MNYGNRLKWLIKNKNYSQKEIARILNISEKTLSDWLSADYPPLKSIEAICHILQIPLSRVFINPDTDLLIEVSDQERRLLKVWNEFSEENKKNIIRLLEVLKEF